MPSHAPFTWCFLRDQAVLLIMIHETDLPCSDCDTRLVEQTAHVTELEIPTNWQGTVVVAECPKCGARYYPEETLSKLRDVMSDSHSWSDN